MRVGAPEHPKVCALADALSIDEVWAFGLACRLWEATMKHERFDGVLRDWSNKAIARACGWRKKADVFVGALVGAGLLDQGVDGVLTVHHFYEEQQGYINEIMRSRDYRATKTKDRRPDMAPPPAPPANADLTIPEVQLVKAYAFCASPKPKAKVVHFRDLKRQGVTDAQLLAVAKDPASKKGDFYVITRALVKKGGGSAVDAGKAWAGGAGGKPEGRL